MAEGPWLPRDPVLFAAEAAPTPASWLFDAGLYAAVARGGLQLRPELATILLTLLLFGWTLRSCGQPDRRPLAKIAVVSALWPNLHASFRLGPVLLAACTGLALAARILAPELARRSARCRLRPLGIATAVAAAASLLNPQGLGAHLASFEAGTQSADPALVSDEWRGLALLVPPQPNTLPAPWPGASCGPTPSRRWVAPSPHHVPGNAAKPRAPWTPCSWHWRGQASPLRSSPFASHGWGSSHGCSPHGCWAKRAGAPRAQRGAP